MSLHSDPNWVVLFYYFRVGMLHQSGYSDLSQGILWQSEILATDKAYEEVSATIVNSFEAVVAADW